MIFCSRGMTAARDSSSRGAHLQNLRAKPHYVTCVVCDMWHHVTCYMGHMWRHYVTSLDMWHIMWHFVWDNGTCDIMWCKTTLCYMGRLKTTTSLSWFKSTRGPQCSSSFCENVCDKSDSERDYYLAHFECDKSCMSAVWIMAHLCLVVDGLHESYCISWLSLGWPVSTSGKLSC